MRQAVFGSSPRASGPRNPGKLDPCKYFPYTQMYTIRIQSPLLHEILLGIYERIPCFCDEITSASTWCMCNCRFMPVSTPVATAPIVRIYAYWCPTITVVFIPPTVPLDTPKMPKICLPCGHLYLLHFAPNYTIQDLGLILEATSPASLHTVYEHETRRATHTHHT